MATSRSYMIYWERGEGDSTMTTYSNTSRQREGVDIFTEGVDVMCLVDRIEDME